MAPPSFLPKIRELATKAAQESGVDDPAIVSAFLAEVESAYQGMMNRLWAKTRTQRSISKIARGRAVAAACDVLCMDPPRSGRRINMRKAKAQKRLLVRSLHPDTGTGDRERLAEVIAAYETLDHYSKMEETDVNQA